jgi:hypothetical protein
MLLHVFSQYDTNGDDLARKLLLKQLRVSNHAACVLHWTVYLSWGFGALYPKTELRAGQPPLSLALLHLNAIMLESY